jgi:hypothetical protein
LSGRSTGTLILVDLDNLVVGWARQHGGRLPLPLAPRRAGGDWLEDDDGSGAGPAPRLDEKVETVVVLAVAARTVAKARSGLSYAYLRRLAARLVAFAGASPAHAIELALTLTMPQAADVALERLAREASSPETAINYDELWLVSGDWGLARHFGRLGRPIPWRSATSCSVNAWRLAEPARRSFSAAPHAVVAPVAPPLAWSRRIETAAHAAWAARQPVQAPPGDLKALADAVERWPGLLTQVGATRTTVRGVARAMPLAGGAPPLIGTCAPGDGLELRGDGVRQPATSPGPASPAAVGIGAAYFPEAGVTARTRLSDAALNDLGVADVTLVAGTRASAAVDDRALLADVPDGAPFGRECQVGLRWSGRHLVATVGRPPLSDATAWWWASWRSAMGARSVLYLEELAGRIVVGWRGPVAARMCRLGDDVVLRAARPLQRGTVVVEHPQSPGEIHCGYLGREQVNVLALDGGAHGAVACRPIQAVSVAELVRRLPILTADEHARLRMLPLLVPECQSAAARSVTAAVKGTVSP